MSHVEEADQIPATVVLACPAAARRPDHSFLPTLVLLSPHSSAPLPPRSYISSTLYKLSPSASHSPGLPVLHRAASQHHESRRRERDKRTHGHPDILTGRKAACPVGRSAAEEVAGAAGSRSSSTYISGGRSPVQVLASLLCLAWSREGGREEQYKGLIEEILGLL
ncbi:unnamed protein product [Calypogeia fissa]